MRANLIHRTMIEHYFQATAGIISIVLICIDMSKSPKHTMLAGVLNNIVLGLGVCSVFVDVIKMNFGFDAAVPVKSLPN